MFWVKFWSYLMGYLTLVIEGNAVEKLINMSVSRGIYLWDIHWLDNKKVILNSRISSFKALRHIARRTETRLRIEEKRGLPFIIAKIRRRQMMVVGALACITLLYILSSFIWFVEVTGNKNVSTVQILKSAEEAGLYAGTAKWKLHTSEVEKQIKTDLPNLSFVGISITGTKVKIKVAEKVIPPEQDYRPANVVATKTGLVEDVLVLAGVAAVEEGTMVQKGDILISGVIKSEIKEPESNNPGELENEDENKQYKTRFVRARGIIKARVWYEGYGEARLINTKQVKTGRVFRSIILKLGNKGIFLKGSSKAPYESYVQKQEVKTLPQWRNINLPVELVITYYYETKTIKEKVTFAGAKKIAEKKAKDLINKDLPEEAKVLDKKVHIIDTKEPNLVRIKVIMETMEDLGEIKPLSKKEMEFEFIQPNQEVKPN